jgi:hypothetical protein
LKDGHKKTVPDTYWKRLKKLCSTSNTEQSKYVIEPVIIRYEDIQPGNIRGTNVFYRLTKTARMRYELQLPILKSESKIENAYRLLFYYIVFYYNPTKKLKNEHEYNELLDKLYINKNELKLLSTSDFKEFKITKWTHPESEIEFTRKDIPLASGTKEISEYNYMLPGISPLEFHTIKESGLPYQPLNLTQDKVTQYFELLEKHKLINRIKLKQLEYLNEERYTIVDNSLKALLADCWSLQSHVLTYVEYYWTSVSKPTKEEKIWFEHLWGKNMSNQCFIDCNNRRREYQKKKHNPKSKETSDRINDEKIQIIDKFEYIKNTYSGALNDYSYFIDPLLNVVYPEFLRKEFSQNN